jgi:N-acetyl sugar amidotransferase
MEYCKICVYPEVAVNLAFEEGVCTACTASQDGYREREVDWGSREAAFAEIAQMAKASAGGNYDCLIPVSGGKDSYHQVHMAVTYGMKPLLVTYHGNNYLPEGDFNRDRMRELFDCDHLVLGPSVEVLKKMNRIAFRKMGDMNWHAHSGIFTFPMQVAVKFRIPLVLWGEIPWDIAGMHSPHDFVEFSARSRKENALRGFDWDDFLGDSIDPLKPNDLNWSKYPTDEEIDSLGLRGIYVGNYFRWDANEHTENMIKTYGWQPSTVPFERTYRTMSNLDDRYENGAHDLLKFIKFGYGRASDHASKDVRVGKLTRGEAVEMVRKHDHVIPSDLSHWLDYVGMTHSEFWKIADGFRDPRVWRVENGMWVKDTIWGDPIKFGEASLSPEDLSKFSKI